MGCGASAGSAPPKDDGTSAEPELGTGTWATKTSSPSAKAAFSTEVETFSSQKGGSFASNKQAMIVLDADEDSDGIETILEAAPKMRPAAANGQEPPEAVEEPRRPQPKPMPKKQVEEAAKVSEVRKRFDNNRYQKQRSSPEPFEMPGSVNTGPEIPYRPAEAVASTKGYPGPQSVAPAREAPTPSLPKTDMMLGLTETGRKDLGDPFGCLPGGIFDDELEDLQQPPVDTKIRPTNQHDEVKSHGFDDDDEMLMKEILDNFDA